MKYVGLVGCAVVAAGFCSPALAGRGNALAGGWDSTLSSGAQHTAPAPAHSGTAPSVSLFSGGFFGGSGYGSGSGSSQNAGGAPSPEVNAACGLILVGATVAFLRRRRTRRAEPQA
ncbi:hypothetical protein MKK69_17900 [Methylobacterium sp. J-026]|uniref:hypothetical protein n=1 Tax=Methylobacterium sp. J-026 TaxID=2836624 RepID=UPI001FB9EFBE|nr:hypothetical protein [Methylobacterium sp. J-026]MCJ2135903.1 hypothetical protein [Methylobacterium sp. J-026]